MEASGCVAASLILAGADTDDNGMMGSSDTRYDACIDSVPCTGVMLTARWTSGVGHDFLGFLEGGQSNFFAFGGECFIAFPSDCKHMVSSYSVADNILHTIIFAQKVIS